MDRKLCVSIAVGTIALLLSWAVHASARELSHRELRQNALKAYNNGNFKDALETYKKLALDADNNPFKVGGDLDKAVACLGRLNRLSETDNLRERAVKLHKNNWRLLFHAARGYFNTQHYGYMIAGEFQRGRHRGGGRYVNSFSRDRIRALQLMDQALQNTEGETHANNLAGFHFTFARILMGFRKSWRLQYLSDLSVLPDYGEGYRPYDRRPKGAPIHPDGSPVSYTIPESYQRAKNDGERWRWNLSRARELNASNTNRVFIQVAEFYFQQFGVQTMADYGSYFRRIEEDRIEEEGKEKTSGTYKLHTLSENETIARLATGIKRFALPREANYINLYQKIVQHPATGYGEQALKKLAQIFENRRQYDKAAGYWEKSIKVYGKGRRNYKQKKVDQILGSWGRFEPVMTHPAGKEATVDYRFRNGKKVFFVAHQIHMGTLLEDVKDYLRSNPRKLEWQKMQIGRIGYRLVEQNEKKYIGDQVAKWELSLQPRKMHFDKRITVKTPLQKAGVYLLTARMQGGNTSKIILWINDTVIVKKQLDRKIYYFVADAASGKPLSRINVEFFGYRQVNVNWKKWIGRHYNILTTNFAENTDENGQVIPKPRDFKKHYHWMITATSEDGRLAYLGFSNIWHSKYYDREYNRTKALCITDRPVYRPNQPVKFKFWVRHARYDQKEVSDFANRNFTIRINNPKGEKIFEKTFTADAYGGFDGEYFLPRDTTLGVYSIHIPHLDGGSFRVEEYKKPEFEVKIKAPSGPVRLGETINAEIKAKYYFGAPVTNARVKYKVLRSSYSANWYPVGLWDWFYGRGYWWFSYDYKWYPGWQEWGCPRPYRWWWPKSRTPPEVVAEAEVKIDRDGTVKIKIDTSFAKAVHGDSDHRYEIFAEVTDRSRRTIVGRGEVLVARKPFKVHAWVDRGHYRVGDVIRADFSAHTPDSKPVKGKGVLRLFRIGYKNSQPVETAQQTWNLDTNEEGRAGVQIKASKAGQYRLSYTVTDAKNHTIEGGYVFCVRGAGFDGKQFRFNEIELVPDKREYRPGDTVNLMINTDRPQSTVVLFVRPAGGIYLPPKVIRLEGKSVVEKISVTARDMPNFFVEAFTIRDGKIYTDTREIVVPPEKRILNVDVLPSQTSYKPGQKAKLKIKLTDFWGEPFEGSAVISVYDKSLEYISGGSNVPEIKAFFWKWRRRHNPSAQTSLDRYFYDLPLPESELMQSLGVFGHLIADEDVSDAVQSVTSGVERDKSGFRKKMRARRSSKAKLAMTEAAAPEEKGAAFKESEKAEGLKDAASEPGIEPVQPLVRKAFADTAFWVASLATDQNGLAEVEFEMPENLTGWKIRTWAMGHGTVVGEAAAEVVTTKNLLLRLQAPRFFVEKDEVVLSANIHNYQKNTKSIQAVLELEGGCLKPLQVVSQNMTIAADGEARADWRVKVVREGEAIVRMKALTDEESDAMEMRFPVYVHGMRKTESFCGLIRSHQKRSSITVHVPVQRRIEQSRMEIRYSPTLAGAMVDALPYMVEYPYGCTEQTLNRFLPTVITQKILKDMGLDLKAIQAKRTNLNARETGDDPKRARQWKRWTKNPVFDETKVADMVKQGLKRLSAMQLSDGGWGWFSGWGEHAFPHTTAHVVRGLQMAEASGVAVVPSVLRRGIKWLKNYQANEVRKLKNARTSTEPWKAHADNLDAFVFMVLVDAGLDHPDMHEFLYRDRNHLAVYGKAMFGVALYKLEQTQKLSMIVKNIEQYLVKDPENQSAYLNLPSSRYWWYWYGSEYEAHAYYLKLLALTEPKSEKAAWLVKYLLNNRKHATYWNSTRDTAICIEAMADYLSASGEDRPDMVIEIYLDGKKQKEVTITSRNLFTFDNKLVLAGKAISAGEHTIEIRRKGTGPVYFNAYLTNFTLEDFITRAGLEIKVDRTYYKLIRVDKTIKVSGSQGQVLDQKVEKYAREKLTNLAELKSGDLVEIELVIDSKNDYEYLVFEDMKAAGFEPVDVRSGYTANELGAYMELRDEKVCFFVRALARGKHSVSYRMRAEIPGKFSALPTRAYAMYAPELKANSNEIKLKIAD